MHSSGGKCNSSSTVSLLHQQQHQTGTTWSWIWINKLPKLSAMKKIWCTWKIIVTNVTKSVFINGGFFTGMLFVHLCSMSSQSCVWICHSSLKGSFSGITIRLFIIPYSEYYIFYNKSQWPLNAYQSTCRLFSSCWAKLKTEDPIITTLLSCFCELLDFEDLLTLVG